MANAKIAAFKLRHTVGLLNGAAYAAAANLHTTMHYEKFSQNALVNALITAITGEPGIAEVDQDAQAITKQQSKICTALLGEAVSAMQRGPRMYVAFLEKVHMQRSNNLRAIQQRFQTAADIDRQIAGDQKTAMKVCAAIQLLSTVFVAITPVGLTFAGATGAGAAGIIGFGYGVSKNLAKDIYEAKGASIIAFDISKDATKEAIGHSADHIADKAAERIGAQTELIREAEIKLAELARRAQWKVSSSKLTKLGRQADRARGLASSAQSSVAINKGIQYSAQALQVVFAAHDIYEGWEDFEKVWNSP